MVDQFVVERITRLALHDVTLGLLIGERDGRDEVSSQVDTQDSDGAKGEGDIRQNEQQEWRDLGDVGGQGVGDRFLQVIEDQPT